MTCGKLEYVWKTMVFILEKLVGGSEECVLRVFFRPRGRENTGERFVAKFFLLVDDDLGHIFRKHPVIFRFFCKFQSNTILVT